MVNFNNEKWFQELKAKLDPDLIPFLDARDGAARFAQKLPIKYKPEEIANSGDKQRAWELVGLFYLNQGRFYEALTIFFGLYNHQLKYQKENYIRCHKGMPLCFISDCFFYSGHKTLAKKYIMLTLCEDAISYPNGDINTEKTGVYPRLVFSYGLPESEFWRYSHEINRKSKEKDEYKYFPEFFLQELDTKWMTETVSPIELSSFYSNQFYIEKLLHVLGDKEGKNLERLASYLMSCIPGCRTYIRKQTPSTDYDVVCVFEGAFVDFRSDFGQYVICECKDWDKPIDSETIRAFFAVMDNTKSKIGVIFSKNGISGKNKDTDSERYLINQYQSKGYIIPIITLEDIENIQQGGNLLILLREKYETIKLDLSYPLG